MIMVLYYPNIDDGYYFTTHAWKNDYIEYLWEKYFNKPFDIRTYLLDDKHGIVYNDLEKKWFNNELDELSISKEPKFTQFLLDKYEDEARNEFERENEWKDPDDWWEDLDEDKRRVIMESYRGY